MNPLGLFLEPPGPLLTHLYTVYMAYSECLPTRLNPLAERTCFSQVLLPLWQKCRVELGPTADFLKDLVKTCPSVGAPPPPTRSPGGATDAVHMMMVTCPVGAETSDCIPQCNAERQGDELLLNMRGGLAEEAYLKGASANRVPGFMSDAVVCPRPPGAVKRP